MKDKRKKRNRPGVGRAFGMVLAGLFAFALILLYFALAWAKKNYGNVSLEEVIFHIKMPLNGVDTNLVRDFVLKAVFPSLRVFCLGLLLILFPGKRSFCLAWTRRGKKGSVSLLPLRPGGWVWAFLFVGGTAVWLRQADDMFHIWDYIGQQLQRSTFIEEQYIHPDTVRITFPEEKKNLICLYVESGESSAQDREHGGLFPVNYIPQMTKVAEENTSFSHSERIEGAAAAPGCGWTIAGLVAQTAGIPLKLPPNYNNVMSRYQYFLPGVVSLGEILEGEGYHNYFLAGSDFTFGGRRRYFTEHGNYTIYDYNWAKKEGKIPSDYKEFWGFEDRKLFAMAKELLPQIARKGEPFQFSLLTVDTHIPSGYLCELCEERYPEKYANVWACASRQIADFVEWFQQQDFYEDTMLFIGGDHLSMNSSFYGADTTDDYTGQVKRKVYNAFVHPFVQAEEDREHYRRFTTMDMFPTILGGLGVQIEGDRLGLGTDLFSGTPTLSETYGYETVFKELQMQSRFYNSELLFPKEE